MSPELSYRMVQIGKAPAGLLGLDECFERLYEEGINPDSPDLMEKLMTGVREHNYIPKPAYQDYEQALVHEYQKFFAQQSGNESYQRASYGTWRGYPREHISWFPTIAPELCDGCGRCIDFCSFGVYEKKEDSKVVVAEPFLCRVGCSSCAAVCDPDAILFPPRDMLKDYRPIG